jgi:leucyl/phenylalanyl-tRNA---protein transferase
MDVQFVTQDLSADMLEANYPLGLFPMTNPGTTAVTWHRPRRRAVIPLGEFHVSRSLLRTLRQARFQVTYDADFGAVMRACATRPAGEGTWIDRRILESYCELHRRGKAHSVEIWTGERTLAGGVYGVHLGGAFFAESKFHTVRDMSKVALAHLVYRLREQSFALLEVQYVTSHLEQFGAIEISTRLYERQLGAALALNCRFV